jgi:hypothetical protein
MNSVLTSSNKPLSNQDNNQSYSCLLWSTLSTITRQQMCI